MVDQMKSIIIVVERLLSFNRKQGSPDIGKFTGRRDAYIRSNVYYDPNIDASKPNSSKIAPDFNRFTSRKDLYNHHHHYLQLGVIDSSKVI